MEISTLWAFVETIGTYDCVFNISDLSPAVAHGGFRHWWYLKGSPLSWLLFYILFVNRVCFLFFFMLFKSIFIFLLLNPAFKLLVFLQVAICHHFFEEGILCCNQFFVHLVTIFRTVILEHAFSPRKFFFRQCYSPLLRVIKISTSANIVTLVFPLIG